MPVRVRGTPQQWFAWLEGDDARRRREATLILGGLDPDDPVDVAALAAGLEAPSERVAFWSAVGLGRLHARAAAAAPRLRDMARRPGTPALAQAALIALARIAPADPRTRAVALELIDGAESLVRQEALRALLTISGLTTEDLRRIERLRHDPDADVASQAQITLRNIEIRAAAP